jgi:Domain of unknown function (DUF4082)
MKKLLILFFLLGILINACKKDDAATTVKPSETPVSTLVSEADWKLTAYTSGKFELGYVFSATAAGKVTQLGAQMNEPGVYTVSVWDGDTKALLRQKSVEQTSPSKFSTAIIDPLPIVKDKKYVVSINNVIGGVSKGYNGLAKTPASSTSIFPISRGSIVIQKSVYSSSATTVYPATDYSNSNTFWGFADITFIPD